MGDVASVAPAAAVPRMPRGVRLALGWLVHVYTASGSVFGLLALRAVWERRPQEALLWMIVATVIDSTDGFLARRLQLWHLIPRISGRRLDDIVDYFTYVAVPVAFLVFLELIPSSPWVFGLPLVASGLGFANEQAKTDDDFFLGFPSYWNVVALYLWILQLSPEANTAIVVLLSVLVLVPTRYIYPSKTKAWQPLTLVLCSLWALQLTAAFLWPDRVPEWWLWTSLAFPVYYVAGSFVLHFTAPPAIPTIAPVKEPVPP
jgi:phosphatidylcholine synthase